MASRSKKKKKSLRRRFADRIPEFDWPRPGKVIGITTWVTGLAGISFAWFLGVPKLQAYVVKSNPSTEIEVRFLHEPVWMSDELSEWLERTARRQISPDFNDRQSLAQARLALLETGCFSDVKQVRRITVDHIEVDASFLHPFAMIVDRDGEHLVDHEGRLLPSAYRAGPESHFIRISGATFNRPLRPGLPWDGADIQAALRLIQRIDGHSWRKQIQSIEVGDIEHIGFLTHRGCRILWGASPGEEAIGEVIAEQKLDRLDYIDRTFGRIDIDCPHELDITDPKVVTAR